MEHVLYWGEMTATEARDYIRADIHGGMVLLPLGVVEAHGPLMPLEFDSKIACLVTHLVAERLLAKGIHAAIYNSISTCGIVSATCELDGTMPYDAIKTTEMIFDTIRLFYEKGIRHFCIINGDGGTGDQWRGLLFYASRDRREFFCTWKGSLDFLSWFRGMERLGHACPYEHATLKYVCDYADSHTRELARRFGLSAHRLTADNLAKIDGVVRTYPMPRTEFASWKQLPGQLDAEGISSFSVQEYQALVASGRMSEMWQSSLDMIVTHLCGRFESIREGGR